MSRNWQAGKVEGSPAVSAASALRRAKDALRVSEARLRLALEGSGVVVFSQDRELRYTWIHNPHPGFKAETVLGKTDADLLPAEDVTHLTRIKRHALESGVKSRQEVGVTIGGRLLYYDLTVDPVRDAAGKTNGIMCVSVDITGRKAIEAQLAQKNAALREIVEQLGAEKVRIGETIASNMEDVVLPLLKKMRLKGVAHKYVQLLEHHLRELTSPFVARRAAPVGRRLTPREAEIAGMIKAGLPSKDIAEMLGVSFQTVKRHRRNIRNRLKLTGKKQNLTTYLAEV